MFVVTAEVEDAVRAVILGADSVETTRAQAAAAQLSLGGPVRLPAVPPAALPAGAAAPVVRAHRHQTVYASSSAYGG